MVTRRIFCAGFLALSVTGIGHHHAFAEELKQVTLRVEGMT